MQAIIDGCKSEKINANISVVISNNGGSKALERATSENIPAFHLSSTKSGSEEKLAEETLKVLEDFGVDIIFLAGYLRFYIPRFLKGTSRGSLIFIHRFYQSMAERGCLE